MQAQSATICSMDDLEQRERQRLARRVSRFREELDLTQGELAARVGISRAYIGHIERGRGSLSFPVLLNLARALGVSVGELTDPDEPVERITQEQAAEYFFDSLRVIAAQQVRSVDVIGYVPADDLRWTGSDDLGNVEVAQHKVSHAQGELFALVVRGDCLSSLGILESDIVILEKPEGRSPQDRQLVLVHIPDQGITLKRWCQTPHGVELRDGDEHVIYTFNAGEEINIQGLYVTFDPVADR